MRFRLLTAVWGEWFVDRFLSMCVPTLLAGGNIPTLLDGQDGTYLIITRNSDAGRMRANPAFVRLAATIDTKLVAWPDDFFERDRFDTQRAVWAHGIDESRKGGEYIIFISPDTVWPDGALSNVGQLFADGKKAVYGFIIRAIDETYTPLFRERFPDTADAISINVRDLVRDGINHLAPMFCCYIRDSRYVPFHAEYILYPVPGEGVILRVTTGHCFGIDPNHFEMNEHHSPRRIDDPDDVAIVTDSDQFVYLSLTPTNHLVGWFESPRGYSHRSPDLIGTHYFSPIAWRLVPQQFRFHWTDMSEDEWQRVGAASDYYMNQIFFRMKLRCLMDVLRYDANSHTVIKIVGAYYARARHMAVRDPVTFFVPTDDAFAKLPAEALASLLSAADFSEFEEALFDHAVIGEWRCPGAENFAPGPDDDLPEEGWRATVQTLSGKERTLRFEKGKWWIDNARVIRRVVNESKFSGEMLVYRIDDVLVS